MGTSQSRYGDEGVLEFEVLILNTRITNNNSINIDSNRSSLDIKRELSETRKKLKAITSRLKQQKMSLRKVEKNTHCNTKLCVRLQNEKSEAEQQINALQNELQTMQNFEIQSQGNYNDEVQCLDKMKKLDIIKNDKLEKLKELKNEKEGLHTEMTKLKDKSPTNKVEFDKYEEKRNKKVKKLNKRIQNIDTSIPKQSLEDCIKEREQALQDLRKAQKKLLKQNQKNEAKNVQLKQRESMFLRKFARR